MEVKINKEIREYTEGIFLGLSLRQCLFSFLACVMAVIFYFLFNYIFLNFFLINKKITINKK